jgi:prenyl protein peptidase
MGLPRFWGRIRVEAGVPIGPPDLKKSDDTSSDSDSASSSSKTTSTRRNLSTIYTTIYYLLLVAGLYGFKTGLWPLTESSNALAGFSQEKKGS